MATGNLTLDAKLTFAKLSRSADFGSLKVPLNINGRQYNSATRLVTTSDGVLPLGDVGSLVGAWIGVKNLGAPLILTPGTPVIANIGSAGAQTWTYKIVAKQKDGGYNIASAGGSTATGNATLTGSNFNRITWAKVEDATGYDIYRTVSGGTPSSTGRIGSTTTLLTFDDTGIAGDSTTAPSTTPFDFSLKIGSDGSLYPLLLNGGDIQIYRWNAAAFHHKALFNSTDMQFLIIEA